MDREKKAEVLLTIAKAYMARGEWLQYDQLSMDRIVRCTARRNAFAPPEAATPDHRLFLDCAAYVWACYYQAFDCRLEADMVINMIDHLSSGVFYYELSHQESGEERKAIFESLLCSLEPGDIISYEKVPRSAHTMIYLGDGQIIHCTQRGGFNGYHYGKMRNIFDGRGGIAIDPVTILTDDPEGKRYLFGDQVKRFSVHRPLDRLGDPVPQALIRAGSAKDLFCSVTSSVAPGSIVERGASFSYLVFVRNDRREDVPVRIEFRPGAGCIPDRGSSSEMILAAGESVTVPFEARTVTRGSVAEAPSVTVNGLSVWVPAVPVGNVLKEEEVSAIRESVLQHIGESGDFACIAGDLYRASGHPFVPDGPTGPEILRRLFFLHDTQIGDVLSRRPQDPSRDGCVYSMFGGTGVITPQNAAGEEIRSTYISLAHLQAGDVIVCSDDALFRKVWTCLWTGKELAGSFGPNAAFSAIAGEAAARYVDSLPGHFCFAVIRPVLYESHLTGGSAE